MSLIGISSTTTKYTFSLTDIVDTAVYNEIADKLCISDINQYIGDGPGQCCPCKEQPPIYTKVCSFQCPKDQDLGCEKKQMTYQCGTDVATVPCKKECNAACQKVAWQSIKDCVNEKLLNGDAESDLKFSSNERSQFKNLRREAEEDEAKAKASATSTTYEPKPLSEERQTNLPATYTYTNPEDKIDDAVPEEHLSEIGIIGLTGAVDVLSTIINS